MSTETPTSLTDSTELSNGVAMPWVGLGTWRASDDEVQPALEAALELGYRHIDTAAMYANEPGIGKVIARSGIPRDQLFVTTKIWNDAIRAGADATRKALDDCLARLDFDYVDLVLLHWPAGDYPAAYRGLEQAYAQGKTRAISVSNFLQHHLDHLMQNCDVRPMVDQVEWHPYLVQPELLAYCQKHHIQPEAWAPLMRGRVSDEPTLKQIAEKHNRTPAQIAIRWELQKGIVTIPKSVHAHRIEENARVFDFELSQRDVQTIDQLDRDERTGEHPDHFTV
jgi:diketogulonate reductase-like aldo/keto reductase